MKTKTALLLAFLAPICANVFAQRSANDLPLLKPYDMSVYLNLQGFSSSPSTTSDLTALAPQSQILMRDFSGFNSDYRTTTSYAGLDVMLGLQFRNKEKTGYGNSSLRIGLGYANGSSYYASLSSNDRKPFDTLVSRQTGNEIYVDSVINKNVSVFYQADFIKLDVAYLWRTGGDSHWSLYGGIGLRGTLGINGYTTVEYFERRGTEQERQDQNGFYNYRSDFEQAEWETENFSEGTSFGGAVYLPLGIDVRFGKTNDFWKRIHLFAEARPGLDFHQIPNIDFSTKPFIQVGLGVRVTM